MCPKILISKDPPNFNLIARPYRWLEYLTLGPSLQRCRTHFLARLLDRRQALVLGDGDGRFLAELLSANPTLHAQAIDSSRSMLNLLRQRSAGNVHRLTTHHADARTFIPSHTCDLIVTHFFLDCLTQSELDRLTRRLTANLRPEGLWLVSDFRIPASGALRAPARILVQALYLAFRILTGLRTSSLPDHQQALTRAGLTRIAHHHLLGGLLTTELWQTPRPAL